MAYRYHLSSYLANLSKSPIRGLVATNCHAKKGEEKEVSSNCERKFREGKGNGKGKGKDAECFYQKGLSIV